LQTYQRESKPIQDVYAQVTQLFHTAPDLLEDFKQFLPESAAQAKAQAAAARAASDEAMISNIRGDYVTGQIAQAQTPRPTTKMPPMGQFDPPSTSKDSKKRRGGLGLQPSTQAASLSSLEPMGAGQSGRGGAVQMGNVNKVSESISSLSLGNISFPKLVIEASFRRRSCLRLALFWLRFFYTSTDSSKFDSPELTLFPFSSTS
jgi:Paired amphipathic helix repeat